MEGGGRNADEEECQSAAQTTTQDNPMQLYFMCASECVCARMCAYIYREGRKRKKESAVEVWLSGL